MSSDESSGARPAAPIVLRIKLRYGDVDVMVQRFAPNVGKSGLFLPTRSLQPLGAEIKFELRLADDTPALVGLGRVKSVRAPDPQQPRAVFGMGVELMRVTPQSRALILRMLEQRRIAGLPEVGLPTADDIDAARRSDGVEHGRDLVSGPTPVIAMPVSPSATEPAAGDGLLTSPRRTTAPIAVMKLAAIAPLSPEPPRRHRAAVDAIIASAAAPLASGRSLPDVDDSRDVNVAAAIARARALAGESLDAELAALSEAGSVPREISVEAASAELARQLGGRPVRRERSAGSAAPSADQESTAASEQGSADAAPAEPAASDAYVASDARAGSDVRAGSDARAASDVRATSGASAAPSASGAGAAPAASGGGAASGAGAAPAASGAGAAPAASGAGAAPSAPAASAGAAPAASDAGTTFAASAASVAGSVPATFNASGAPVVSAVGYAAAAGAGPAASATSVAGSVPATSGAPSVPAAAAGAGPAASATSVAGSVPATSGAPSVPATAAGAAPAASDAGSAFAASDASGAGAAPTASSNSAVSAASSISAASGAGAASAASAASGAPFVSDAGSARSASGASGAPFVSDAGSESAASAASGAPAASLQAPEPAVAAGQPPERAIRPPSEPTGTDHAPTAMPGDEDVAVALAELDADAHTDLGGAPAPAFELPAEIDEPGFPDTGAVPAGGEDADDGDTAGSVDPAGVEVSFQEFDDFEILAEVDADTEDPEVLAAVGALREVPDLGELDSRGEARTPPPIQLDLAARLDLEEDRSLYDAAAPVEEVSDRQVIESLVDELTTRHTGRLATGMRAARAPSSVIRRGVHAGDDPFDDDADRDDGHEVVQPIFEQEPSTSYTVAGLPLDSIDIDGPPPRRGPVRLATVRPEPAILNHPPLTLSGQVDDHELEHALEALDVDLDDLASPHAATQLARDASHPFVTPRPTHGARSTGAPSAVIRPASATRTPPAQLRPPAATPGATRTAVAAPVAARRPRRAPSDDGIDIDFDDDD